jgi:hypothetical protein
LGERGAAGESDDSDDGLAVVNLIKIMMYNCMYMS